MGESSASYPDRVPGGSPASAEADTEWAESGAWPGWAGGDSGPEDGADPEGWTAGADHEGWAWGAEREPDRRSLFAQDGVADVLPPVPFLAALTEQAAEDLGRLSDNELIGVLQATRRQITREQYKQVLVIAEFGRRRQAAFEDAARRGIPVGCRPGGFPGEELAIELVTTRADAGHRIDDAIDLTTRLPCTLAGMAAGQIDQDRAGWIALYTRSLGPDDLARADEVLAEVAPDLRVEQLARKAAALEMKLNPEAVKARKEHAKRNYQRVEARREISGNASLAGRELDSADVMASKAHIDSIAVKLRRSGLIAGTLDRLRALAMIDLTQGRNPLDRLTPRPAPAPDGHPAGPPPSQSTDPRGAAERDPLANSALRAGFESVAGSGCRAGSESQAGSGRCAGSGSQAGSGRCAGFESVAGSGCRAGSESQAGSGRCAESEPLAGSSRRAESQPQGQPADEGGNRLRSLAVPGESAPLPALINILVPAGTLLGWSAAPAQAGSWGLLDDEETRAVVSAASAHPRTRWCVTLTGADGTARAHSCARGQHPRLLDDLAAQPPPDRLGELLLRLGLKFTPIARGSCDHAYAEAGYVPSRALRHLVRARSATCDAPGCQSPAVSADLDHTVSWPDGATDQCNLAPRCRTHHRAKQAPDWTVEQTRPGVTRWTMPSGRTRVTMPTGYDT